MSQVSDNCMEAILPHTMNIVGEPLTRVETMLRSQLQSEVPIIDEMVNCGGATGGKRFRPILLLLAAQATGGIEDQHIMLATSVEMIHAATLVHDDIIDNATTRRHVTTINNRWGNQGAVLFGDFLFTQAFYLASLTGSAEACQIIGRATNLVCEGELQQSDAAGNFETTVDEYFEIISKKTAALCACATELGASFCGDPASVKKWKQVGMDLGLAFQIVDDVLDLKGDATACGKTLGTDLETAKPTLPILLGLQMTGVNERAKWLNRLSRRELSRDEVTRWLNETGAMQAAEKLAEQKVQSSVEFTRTQNSIVAAAFQELSEFLLARNN